MPQVEKEKTGGGASGRNVGESIETEKQQQGRRATDSGGDCVGGPVETFVASGSSSSASRASSSSRSASSSVSPQPPPLTLIDANVASSAVEQQQQKQRGRAPQSLSPASSDKSHQDSLARRSQQRKRATRGEQVGSGSARALDKLSGLDKQPQQQPLSGSRYHDKASGQVELGAAKDSQRLAELRAEAEAAAAAAAKKKAEEEKDEDELNNNSIHLVRAAAAATHAVAHRSHQQQQRESGQSVKSPNASLSPPIKHSQAQQTKEISPLSLLTGLRMHTNNLRNQQQQAQGGNGESNHQQSRNPQTSGNNELHSSQSQSQSQSHRAPLTVSGANRFAASPATTTSPASFVESSLNPDDDDGGGTEAARQPGGYVPSYTSIFNKPISPPSSERQQQQQVSSITTTSRLSESTSRMVTNRSPLRKQSAQFDLSSTSANSRSLFAAPPPPPPSASAKQETTTTTRRLPLLLRAPDYSRRPLNAETFDCDDLEAGNSAGRGNLESSEEDDDDHHHQDMNDLELDDVDDLEEEEELDEKSPFSGRRPQPPSHLNQPANRSSRPAGLSNSRDSVRRATDNQQQQQHDKYPGSAKLSRHLGNQKQPASSAQSHRGAMSVKKQQMAQATSPQAQHTKISIGEMSRPPSFNTTTGQCQNQQKASCRKLDLLEQVAHLECSCHICSKNRKLASLHDNLYYHTHLSSNGKLSQFDFSNSSSAKLHKIDKGYPKTHFMHLVLKSIILILCMLLLLLVLVGSIMLSISLPHSMDKVVNATRSFNVTIAGR